MRVITVYQCEICDEDYSNEAKALECENQPKRVPKYVIGDTIPVHTRYDGIQNTIVKDIVFKEHYYYYLSDDSFQLTKDGMEDPGVIHYVFVEDDF